MRKAVVVHGGARDSYQLALGLSEAGSLESLVTDLFWPADLGWARKLEARMSPGLREMVSRRSAPGLPSAEVTQCAGAGLRGLVVDKLPGVPFSVRRRSNRAADATLGRTAGRLARETGSGLVSYSYFGYDAMREFGGDSMLFQVHPHPATVRRILLQEWRRTRIVRPRWSRSGSWRCRMKSTNTWSRSRRWRSVCLRHRALRATA